LSAAGFLTDVGVEFGEFAGSTEQALCEFQRDRGLRIDGRCDEETWASLVESSWMFGTRPLLITSPHLRGDDVAELQARLARLGFDTGRIDGIFGPQTARAVAAFHSDSGLLVDSICGAATAQSIRRVSSQTGTGPGIAVLREREHLRGLRRISDCRVAVGQFGGLSTLTRHLVQALRSEGATVISLDEPDPVRQAVTANDFDADVYLGFEAVADARAVIHYYRVPAFESVEGRSLAERLGRSMRADGAAFAVEPQVSGVRLPVLRETRMPAVLVVLGPARPVCDRAASETATVIGAVAAWLAREG
jgi:N-acetylmuramoyl-L-alanine amidase